MKDTLKDVVGNLAPLHDQTFILIALIAVILTAAWIGFLGLYRSYAKHVKELPKKDRLPFLKFLVSRLPDNLTDNRLKAHQSDLRFRALVVTCVTLVLLAALVFNRKEVVKIATSTTNIFVSIIVPQKTDAPPDAPRDARPRSEERPRERHTTPLAPGPDPTPVLPLPHERVARTDLEKACVGQIGGLMLDSDRTHWCTCGIGAMLDAGVTSTIQRDMLSDFEWALSDAKMRYPDLEKRLARCAV